MIRTLTPVGDEMAIVIDRAILEQLNINGETPLEVTTDGKRLLIVPAKADGQEEFVASAKRMMAVHHETFRKLAE